MGMLFALMLLVGCTPVQPAAPVARAETAAPTAGEAGEMPAPEADASAADATVAPTAAVSPTVDATPQAGAAAPAEPAPAAGNETPAPPEGLAVYRAQYCGVCHVLDAAETRGTFGPTHNDMGAIAAARIQETGYNGDAETAAGYLRESIVDPKAYIVPEYAQSSHSMPVYSHLPEEDVDALVHFLLAQ